MTLIEPMTIYIPTCRQISPMVTEIWRKNTNPIQNGSCCHFEFYQRRNILGYVRPITIVWSISINVPNLTEISSFTTEIWSTIENSKWQPPPPWILKSVILGLSDPCMANICKPNLVQIGPEIVEIHLFMYFQDGGRPPSWICFTLILDRPRRAKFSLLMAEWSVRMRLRYCDIAILRIWLESAYLGQC